MFTAPFENGFLPTLNPISESGISNVNDISSSGDL